jgi:predicted secreted protein
VELHQYLNDTDVATKLEDEPPNSADRRMSVSSSIKSERRRSLPARTSMISLASEHTISTPKAEITSFQLRRRRAAKLTQFFGVNYRELINDVLDSIENGVQHEQESGTLRAEEVEVSPFPTYIDNWLTFKP